MQKRESDNWRNRKVSWKGLTEVDYFSFSLSAQLKVCSVELAQVS